MVQKVSIKRKLVGYISALVLLVIFTFVFVTNDLYKRSSQDLQIITQRLGINSLRKAWEQQARSLVGAFVFQLEKPLAAQANDRIHEIALAIATQRLVKSVFVLDADRVIRGTNPAAAEQLGREATAALPFDPLRQKDMVMNWQPNILEVTAPIRDGAQYLGILKIGFSTYELEFSSQQINEAVNLLFVDALRNSQNKIVLYSVLILIAGLAFAYLLARELVKPVRRLVAETQKISEGNFDSDLKIDRHDEMAELYQSFIQMADKLKRREDSLKEEIEERRRATEMAQYANRAKSQFLANMSHELRTPLNHIIGFTELVLDRKFGTLNERQEEYLGDVLSSSYHLLSLINDILDLAKIEAGKIDYDPCDVNLGLVLERSLTMIKEKSLKHGIQIEKLFGQLPSIIAADERKLRQILYNLLSNAAKFTPDRGSIRLSADLIQCDNGTLVSGSGKRFELPLSMDGNHDDASQFVEISVQDSGIGIDKDNIDRIFEPFDQAEADLSRRFEGTGLGLALAKKFVELHGGTIWAESEGAKKGSRFNFIIPI